MSWIIEDRIGNWKKGNPRAPCVNVSERVAWSLRPLQYKLEVSPRAALRKTERYFLVLMMQFRCNRERLLL